MGAIRDFLGALALVKFPNNNVKKITAADLREYQDAVAQKIEENIPYVDSSQIGAVTTTANSLTVALHPSGENYAIIGGVKYAKLSADPPYSFTPVSPGKLKSLIYYAKPDSTVFYLAEGVEGLQAVDPDYDGLLIKKIIITDSGAIIEPDLTQYQLKANQAWVNLVTNDNGGIAQTISIHHGALRFNIISSDSNIKFGGFRFYASQFLYDGVEITIRNGTAGTLEVVSIIEIGVITINPDGTPIKLKSFETLTLAYHLVDGFFYALKSGGGGASFPEIGSNGDILEKDSTVEEGAKWVTKIKGTTDKMLQYWNETAGNFASSGIEYISAGIVKMKVIAFGGYTILQRNAIASPTEGMLIYVNEAPKGFQKYENGAWATIGSNISNADLSNVSVRTFNLGNHFTWITNGFDFYVNGNIKTDGLKLPNNISAVSANVLRNNGGRLKYSDDLSAENTIAYISDLQSRVVVRYIHNTNTVFQPTTIDYATGYITVVSHGFTSLTPKLVGVFTNEFLGIRKYDGPVIPTEYINALIYIKKIDDDTLMICNSAGSVISVNPTSSTNNGRLDISKWHIENFSDINLGGIPFGLFTIKIVIKGIGINGTAINTGGRYLSLEFYDMSGIPFIQAMSLYNMSQIQSITNRNDIEFMHESDINIKDGNPLIRVYEKAQNLSATPAYASPSNSLIYPNVAKFSVLGGVSGIKNISTYNWMGNGTIIEIIAV